MLLETTTAWTSLVSAVGTVLYIMGGVRFRRWAVEDRAGIPRYSPNVETVMLWLVYSVGISIVIVVIRQTLRQI